MTKLQEKNSCMYVKWFTEPQLILKLCKTNGQQFVASLFDLFPILGEPGADSGGKRKSKRAVSHSCVQRKERGTRRRKCNPIYIDYLKLTIGFLEPHDFLAS